VKHILAAVTCVIGFSALAASAQIPNPKVTGPIASTAVPGDPSHNYVFFSADHGLAAAGYIEEEYFIEGTAKTFTTPTEATGAVSSTGNPYKTRIVVRRPADAAKFNGTVLVEWSNVTNGFDAENLWFFAWEHILRAGYAWVGVSAQQVGVNRLETWNPARYGSLSVAADDSLCYDIFSQAGQAIRHPQGINVLGNLKPKTYLAVGESQSAFRLASYVNSVMPLGNVWDGVLLESTFGQAIRTDLQVPVFKVLWEWDTQSGEAAVRQPDTKLFHRWEVAGTAHVDHHLRLSREPLELRDLGTSSEAALAPTCQVPNIGSRAPNHYVLDAAIEGLVKWVQKGTRPATSPLFKIASFGPGTAATIARDQYGNAIGGVHLSQMSVPIASNVGQNNGANAASACPRWGYHLPFELSTLNSLYPSHHRYVDEVAQVTLGNVRNGFLLGPDAVQTIEDAISSSVGAGKNVLDDARDRLDYESDPEFRWP
jgi:Alpha/beta hydrolase domain